MAMTNLRASEKRSVREREVESESRSGAHEDVDVLEAVDPAEGCDDERGWTAS